MIESTNTAPPFFGPTWPLYPHLEQLVRVTGGAMDGTNPAIYPCSVQQYDGALSLRSRESAYVMEPNGVTLGPSVYDCRLIGSYNGLPLFATTCCPPTSSSSAVAH